MIVIAVVSVALAACSVAPAAEVTTASKAPAGAPAPGSESRSLYGTYESLYGAHRVQVPVTSPAPATGSESQSLYGTYESLYGTYRVQVPVATPAPDEDVQSLHWTYMKRDAAHAPVAGSHAGSDSPSSLTSRADGRAPAAARAPHVPAEDFQSLHATYGHLAR